jgi:hypothetical protein
MKWKIYLCYYGKEMKRMYDFDRNGCSVGNPVLPLTYDDSLSYEEQIAKLYKMFNELKTDRIYNNTFNITDSTKLADAVIPRKLIRNYTYDMMVEDIDTLMLNYPKVRKKIIGTSVLGLPLIAMEYGTETATRHMFVFNGFHGTDCSASIAIAQMEVLAKNATYGGVDMWSEILDNDTCIHVIPMANPDAWMLGLQGYSYFNDIPESIKTKIEELLTDYIRNHAKDEPNGSTWDVESRTDLENYIRSLGGDPSVSYEAYVFREKDLHAWKANANGIDLHYNWWTDAMKHTVDVALKGVNYGHADAYVYGAQGIRAYVDENASYRAYISQYERSDGNYYFTFMNYHQKGPTNIWNYRLKGLQNNRNFDCGVKLCELMQVPYSPQVGNQSTPIGFSAWAGINYAGNYTLSYTNEVGWKHVKKRGDWWDDENSDIVRSPVPDNQWNDIYTSNKAVFIWMLRYYASLRDVWNRHQYLSEYNLKDSYTDERFAIPSMAMMLNIANKVGAYYTSLSEMGFSNYGIGASLDDILTKLNWEASATFNVGSAMTVAKDLPTWSFSKSGNMKIFPVSSKQMMCEFYVNKTTFIYRCLYIKDSDTEMHRTEWVNATPSTTDYVSMGIADGIVNSSVKAIASKVPIYHELIIDLNKKDNNVAGLPSDVGDYYRLKVTGHRPNNRVEITDISSGNIWVNHYSRTNDELQTWYKIQASPLA